MDHCGALVQFFVYRTCKILTERAYISIIKPSIDEIGGNNADIVQWLVFRLPKPATRVRIPLSAEQKRNCCIMQQFLFLIMRST